MLGGRGEHFRAGFERRTDALGGGGASGARKSRHAFAVGTTEFTDSNVALLSSFLDEMGEGFAHYDHEDRLVFCNRTFVKLHDGLEDVLQPGIDYKAFLAAGLERGLWSPEGENSSDWLDRLLERRNSCSGEAIFQLRNRPAIFHRHRKKQDGGTVTICAEIPDVPTGNREDQNATEMEIGEAFERSKLAQAVLDGLPIPVFVKDANLEFVLVNKAFAAQFNTEPNAMIGKKSAEFISDEEAWRFEENERHVLQTGESYRMEEDVEKAGVKTSRLVSRNRVETESGRPYVTCSILDITDLKRRELDAQEARAQLALVLETMPAGVIIYDKDDRFVLGNRKIHDALPALAPAMQPGCSLKDALKRAHEAGYFRESGDEYVDGLYDTDRDAWVEEYAKLYQLRQNVFERRNHDGRWFKAIDTRQEDGTFIGVRVDITELKTREQELRESMRENEVFRNLVDNVPASIYVKRSDLRLSYVNKGWSDLMGVAPEDAIGKTDVELFGSLGEHFAESDLAVLQSGKRQEREEMITDRNGEKRYQIARKDALVASDGSLYLIGSTMDVTELKRRQQELSVAQEKAVAADRAKSEFLANMSHEIRTPMNGILGMAELLGKTELSPKQKTFNDIIVKSGTALLTIINDILDFSKIDAGQLELDPQPFNLAEAVEDVATLISSHAKEKELELIVRVDPALPENFLGDVGRIRQIVTNLLGNAVKFTDRGHILVDVAGETLNEATKLTISVSDSGIGIPEEKLAIIFDKFSQVDASSTRRHEGTGLGLAISSRLVGLMGGEMGVKSKEGEGSTFWFTITLPLAERGAVARIVPRDVTGARVLVIDDNAINRTILAEQMAHWGFDACAAESGEEGLRVLEAAAELGIVIDCAVIDHQMPGMSGIETARAIRNSEQFGDVPIVMLSSVDQSLSTGNLRGLSIDAHIIKPARASSLLEAVVRGIQRFRGRREGDPIVEDFPLSRSNERADVPSETAAQEQGSGLKVLVAEDNEVNQLVFSQILSESGFTFTIVKNGREAVEVYQKQRPGLVLMDVSMPEMSGIEAAQKIRELEAQSQEDRVPIIGVTAHALKGDRERCLEAGMDDYLSKPISPRTLLEKIHLWCGKSESERSVWA